MFCVTNNKYNASPDFAALRTKRALIDVGMNIRKTMDYIPDLSAFQAVLRSADNQYSFASLKFREGNEEKIKHIVEKVFNFLKEKNYFTGNIFLQRKSKQLKKLALYLVLNADLPALEEMSGLGGGVGALVRTLPALPGPLLTALMWEQHMRPFLYEMVAFCRPALALQLADACIADLQPDDPASDPQHLVKLAGALYRLTCRLHFARAPPGWAPGVALASLRACLVHLDRLYRNHPMKLARILLCTFDLIETCYGYFTSVQKLEPFSLNDIYQATHEPDGLKTEDLDFKICDSPDRAISESLRACNALLLDHCAGLMMNFSSDTICDSDLKQTFGEECYRMNAVLQRISDAADHRLVGMLEQNSIEPCDPGTVIGVIDPDVIALKIRARDATSAAWLDALLDRKDLCRRPTLMRLLLSEAATLDEGQSAQLFDSITWVLYGLSEDGALQRRVAIEAFRRCSDSTKDLIVSKQFHNWFHNDLMTVDFEAALSETFDRLAAGVAGPGDALAVFVQNPGLTLERLVRAAGDDAAQTELMLRIVERLGECRGRCNRGQSEPALVLAVNAALDDAAAAEDDARRQHLARFVEELVRRRLLGEELLRDSTPEARAAATAIKEEKKEDLPPEDLTAGSYRGQKTASFSQPDKAKLPSMSFSQPAETKPLSGLFGQPAIAKPSSGSFGQLDKAKRPSGSFGRPTEAKPLSGLFGQPTEAKPLSGLFGQPTEANPLSGLFTQPTEANPLSGSFGQPTEAKPSSESFGQPDKAKLPSGSFGQPTEAKPLAGLFGQPTTKPFSGSFGQPEKAKLPSGSFGQPTEAKPLAGLLGQPTAKPLSGLFGQPTAKPLSGSFGQPDKAKLPSGSFGQPTEAKPLAGLFGQPTEAKPSSESFGQPDKAKLPSGSFGQPTEAKPLSGLFGQSAIAKLSSMSFGQPTKAKPSIWSFGQPDETKPLSQLFGHPAIAKPSSGLFGQQAEAKSLAKNLSQPAGANSLLLGSSPGQGSCDKRVTSLVYKCSACGLCFDRHEAMYKHFTNCVPLKIMTRIHCMCGLEFDRNNYDYHCEVHRKSTQLVKKTVRIDNDLDIDVREMKKDFMEDDEANEAPKESQIGHANQETVSAVHKFIINFVPLHDKHTTKSTDILAAKLSVVYRCTCKLCFERPDFLFNHINNSSCVKKVTRINCVCGLVFDKHNYDHHCEIHRNYSVLRVKKITIMNDEMIFVGGMMQEFAEDEERKAVNTKKDAQVQTVDLHEPGFRINGTIDNLSGHKIVSAVIDTIDSGINGEDNRTKITIVMAKESEKTVERPNEANPGDNKNNEVIEIRDFETNASEIADDIASSITLATEGDHEANDNQEASGIEQYEHTAPTEPDSKDISDSDSSDEEANEITEQLKHFNINYNEETSE